MVHLCIQWGEIMGLRVFSINKDGSYFEVPSERDSFLHGDGAYLIVDRKEKKIYIYRKLGISSILSYSAARAATNLNTQKGSRYKIINIEEEDKDRILPSLYQKLDIPTLSKTKDSKIASITSKKIVYGEKTVPVFETHSFSSSVGSTGEEGIKYGYTQRNYEKEIKENFYKIQNVDELIKTLANQILFETKLDNAKKMEKPARHILKAEMVRKIDTLLDVIYGEED